jgi:hypothetical protein
MFSGAKNMDYEQEVVLMQLQRVYDKPQPKSSIGSSTVYTVRKHVSNETPLYPTVAAANRYGN